ncbi:MAG TPA: ATP/GTP-binding protein [Streptosporangiaceae bacterium]|jgi:hypothetical protein
MSPRKARRLPGDVPRRPRRAGRVPPSAGPGGSPGTRDDDAGRDLGVTLGLPQAQSWPDGDWLVRQVPGAAATKTYRCPGCDQEIRPGVGHLVVWPDHAPGPQERRHWHNACWQRRPRRPGPGPRTHR